MTEEKKDVFSGATIAYTAYFSYVKEVINEFGKEKALELMTRSDTARGIRAGAEIKEMEGGKDFSVEETKNMIVEMAAGIGGVDITIEESEECAKTVTEMGKCPVYEAGKANGLDDEMIEALCRASSLAFLNNVVKQLNPKLYYDVTAFRSEKYNGCLEEIRYE